jgi:hypothetical protein
MIARMMFLCSLILLAGCSSDGRHRQIGTGSALQDSYESVKLVISPTAANSTEIVPDLRSSVVGQLLSTGRFRRLAAANEDADVVVTVEITDYQRVTVAERVLVGALAGRNRIATKVTITDGRSGERIRGFEASGRSAAHPLSSEGGYSDALREVSKQLMLGLSS